MSDKRFSTVFTVSAAIIFLFVIIGITFTQTFKNIINATHGILTQYLGWYFLLVVTFFIGVCIWLFFSKYGNIRLGKDSDRPEYGYFAWVAMLFSAGMGIGLIFFGVAEPMLHFLEPPIGEGGTEEAALTAMNFSFFHWGLHAWATYIIVALTLGYFCFRKGLPLSLRYAFKPLFGEKIHGPIGQSIDIIAIVGTLFGVATSLGIGAMQISTGLGFLGFFEPGLALQVMLIILITLIATVSVVSGLNKGIKWLSSFNVSMAAILLLFVFIAGPTLFLIEFFFQNVGQYVQNIISTSLWTNALSNSDWQGSWTVFYWAWWIAWAPYVGMFIARISKGRTIKEFIATVLLVPTIISFLWLTVFGGTGINLALAGNEALPAAVQEDYSIAIFELFTNFPLTEVISGIAIIVITTFFVTSSDSGSLVIDIISSEGNKNPPKSRRIFWALTEGAVAVVLLIGGGLVALQTASILMALPFSIVMLGLIYNLTKSLRSEK